MQTYLSTTEPTSYDPGYEMPEVPPLCVELYHRLQARVPGGVRIANQGESMTGSIVTEGNKTYWSVATWGETYRVNCPFCKENRHRLWISHRFGQPDPADMSKLGMFYGICFNMDCLSEPGNRKALYDDIFGIRDRNILKNPLRVRPGDMYDGKLKEVLWPGHVVPLWRLPEQHPAWHYMTGARSFNRNTAIQYDLHYCTQADARYSMVTNRIVAPFHQFDKMVGWQARYVGEPAHKGIPKYYTMPGMPKRQILYNHDRSADYPFVVVFEGITDVWRLGDPSVAICGKTMSTGQRLLLQQTWADKPVILCLDPEAREESAGIIHEMQKSNVNPLVNIKLDGGWDPAMYSTATLLNIVYSQANAIGVSLPEIG